jgi:acyl carrier protein
MNDREIRDHIYGFVKSRSTVHNDDALTIGDTVDLVEAGIVNSIGFIELISGLEAKFNVQLDLENMDTVEYSTIAGLTSVITKSKQ